MFAERNRRTEEDCGPDVMAYHMGLERTLTPWTRIRGHIAYFLAWLLCLHQVPTPCMAMQQLVVCTATVTYTETFDVSCV